MHSTLAGRLVFGPAWNIGRYLRKEAAALARRDRAARQIWLSHGLGVIAVLFWVVAVCGINPLFYALCIVYPSASILLLRSFAEHRANDGVFERTAIVEHAPIFGFLFLFNNLHAAHHERPSIPWFELPRWYTANRDRLVSENGGLVYQGYGEVARRFLFAPHHVTVHPHRGRRPETRKRRSRWPVGMALRQRSARPHFEPRQDRSKKKCEHRRSLYAIGVSSASSSAG